MPRKPATAKILLSLDVELLERFDRYWRDCGFSSRRQAVRHALEIVLADRAAHLQHEQAQANPGPGGGFAQAGPTHTANSDSERRSRPLTADLTIGF